VVATLAERYPGGLGDAVLTLQHLAERAQAEGRSLGPGDLSRRLASATPADTSFRALVEMVAERTGIDAERIRSAEKSRDVALARHLCVYLATRSLGLSARQVSRSLRVRSPSISSYAKRQVERRRNLDPAFHELIQALQARIEGAQRDFGW